MLSELSTDQKALAIAISAVSEAAYCASWMDGLEYALWHLMTTDQVAYGRSRIKNEEKDKLRQFSEKCGGWIIWDEKREQVFVPRKEWELLFQSGIKKRLLFIQNSMP
jgi:hypothetical protein